MTTSYHIANTAELRPAATLFVVHDRGEKTVFHTLIPEAPPGAHCCALYHGSQVPAIGDALSQVAETQQVCTLASPIEPSRLLQSRVKPDVKHLLCNGLAPSEQGALVCDPPSETTMAQLDAILNTDFSHTSEPLPSLVEDFDCYVLPPGDTVGYLERVNGTAQDRRLSFDEDSHTYTLERDDGSRRPTNGSVTYLAHKYEADFEPKRVIAKMRRSRNWPRIQYCHGARKLCAYDPKLSTYVLYMDEHSQIIAKHTMDGLPRVRNPSSLCSCSDVMDDAHIQALWGLKGHRTSNRGTEAHYQIERFMNRDMCHVNTIEFSSFVSFALEVMLPMQLKAYRTEWRIFCEDTNVAGSVDFIGELPNGELVIIDWKRSDKLRDEATTGVKFYVEKMKTPMDHLPCSATAGYTLQLSLYRHIIQEHYNRRVVGLILVQIGEHPFYTFVPPLEAEASYIMAARRHENCVAAAAPQEEQVQTADAMASAHAHLMACRRPWDVMMGNGAITLDAFNDGAVDSFTAQAVSPPCKKPCSRDPACDDVEEPLFAGAAAVARGLRGAVPEAPCEF